MIFWDYEQITQVLFIIGDKVNLTGHARSGFNFNKTKFTDQKKVEMFMFKNQGQG